MIAIQALPCTGRYPQIATWFGDSSATGERCNMILTISVNRDSYGSDPWVVSVLPPSLLTDLHGQLAYSVVVMTLTDGMLDSQEFRIIIGPNDDGYQWTLLSGRMATTDANNGIFQGVAGTEDESVTAGVLQSVQLATAPPSPSPTPPAGFA